jgi:hypothetical protein
MNINTIAGDILTTASIVFNVPVGAFGTYKGSEENGFILRLDGYAAEKRQITGNECLLAVNVILTGVYSVRINQDMNTYKVECEKSVSFVNEVIKAPGVSEVMIRDVEIVGDGDFAVFTFSFVVNGLVNA